MLIRVKYQNNKFDMVKPWLLNRLINVNRIKAFCRRTGWVDISSDKIRSKCDSNYKGPDRRKKEAFNPFALLYLYLVLSYQVSLDGSDKMKQG